MMKSDLRKIAIGETREVLNRLLTSYGGQWETTGYLNVQYESWKSLGVPLPSALCAIFAVPTYASEGRSGLCFVGP